MQSRQSLKNWTQKQHDTQDVFPRFFDWSASTQAYTQLGLIYYIMESMPSFTLINVMYSMCHSILFVGSYLAEKDFVQLRPYVMVAELIVGD